MTTIVTKNGSGAPLASDLVQGELAVDLTNKRLYTEDSGGTVIEVGTNPSTIDINAGTIDGTVIGGTTAAAGTFTTFTSTGIDDNATSTAIAIDSSQNVVLGNTSTSFDFEIYRSGASSQLAITGGNASVSDLLMGDTDDNNIQRIRSDHSDNSLQFQVNNSERMRIDSSGNCLIGTTASTGFWGPTSSSAKTVIQYSDSGTTVGTASKGLVIQNYNSTTGNQSSLVFGTWNSVNTPIGTSSIWGIHDARTSSFSTGQLAFGTMDGAGAIQERMRIDASGNLLVGTTSTTPAVSNDSDGIALQSNGTVQFSANATTTAIINRKATDGSILQFRKDGTTVGSIQSDVGYLNIGTGSTRLVFVDASPQRILPRDASNSASDGLIDLGDSGSRFNDLYLSGGAYLGGAGAANYLDDYEKGTWTPTDVSGAGLTFTGFSGNCSYIKIGKQVVVHGRVVFPSTANASNANIGGLPFVAETNTNDVSGGFFPYQTYASGAMIAVDESASSIFIYDGSAATASNSNLSTKDLRFVLVYFTA